MWWSTKSGTRYACSNISQNRKHSEHPDGPWLAKSGMVPRTARSHDRLSSSSLTGAETAQADLLTTLPPTFVESQPTRLEVIKGFHKEGFFFLKRLLSGSQNLRGIKTTTPLGHLPPPPPPQTVTHSPTVIAMPFSPWTFALHIIFVYKILK